MTLTATVLYEDARAAYAEARHEVFDLPDWTPTTTLTADQTRCLRRLDVAEDAVREYRRETRAA